MAHARTRKAAHSHKKTGHKKVHHHSKAPKLGHHGRAKQARAAKKWKGKRVAPHAPSHRDHCKACRAFHTRSQHWSHEKGPKRKVSYKKARA